MSIVNRRPDWAAKAGVWVAVWVLTAGSVAAQSTTTYSYDPLGRLQTVSRLDGPTTTYVYDAANNRTQRSIGTGGTTPTPFNLGGPVAAASGVWASSNTITVSGMSAAVPVTIASGQYRINGGTWQSAAGSVTSGQTLQVRVQSPAAGGAGVTATLVVGGISGTFRVTAIIDTTPDAFDLGPAKTVAPTTWAESASATISGINVAAPISVTNGEYRVNSGAWQTAAGSVSAGQTVQLRVRALAAGYSRTGTLTIGGVSRSFQVTAAGVVTPPPGCTPPPGRDECIEA